MFSFQLPWRGVHTPLRQIFWERCQAQWWVLTLWRTCRNPRQWSLFLEDHPIFCQGLHGFVYSDLRKDRYCGNFTFWWQRIARWQYGLINAVWNALSQLQISWSTIFPQPKVGSKETCNCHNVRPLRSMGRIQSCCGVKIMGKSATAMLRCQAFARSSFSFRLNLFMQYLYSTYFWMKRFLTVFITNIAIKTE